MQLRTILIIVACLISMAVPTHAQTAGCEDALAQAARLSDAKDFDSAVSVLNQSCAGDFATRESRLLTARILSWAGRYAEAEGLFGDLLAGDPGNLDVLVARGSLHYYKGEFDQAEAVFVSVLAQAPEYTDARLGLQRVRDAKSVKDEALGAAWRVDVNYSEIRVDGPQPDWTDFTARAAYRHGNYSYSAQIAQLDRFGFNDTEVTLGVDRVARRGTNVSAHVSFTPNADFRADVGVGVGASHTFDPKWGPVLQLGLNYDYDSFDENDVHTIVPSLAAYFQNGLVLSGRIINVAQASEFTTGWLTQAYMPLGERFSARVGYGQAPEVINGIALDTKSLFGGVSFKVVEGVDLSFNYARDDREAAFDREGFNVGLTFRR